MQDSTQTLAKLAIRKEVKETEDPLLVYTMLEGAPEMQPGLKLSTYTEKENETYNACLVFFHAKESCCFYKHCIRKGCKTDTAAQLIAEYGKNSAIINCPSGKNNSSKPELNLN